MKIVRMTAENIKKLSAVEITPSGRVVIIGGKNGQGKTSVLDIIEMAVDWKTASKKIDRPIKDGQEKGSLTLELGDLVIERRFTQSNSYLTVMNKDGFEAKSPQQLIDNFVGQLSLDPMEFDKLPEDKQVQTLIKAFNIKFDMEKNKEERKILYEERAGVNAESKKKKALIAQMKTPEINLPDKEASILNVSEELKKAYAVNNKNDEAKMLLANLEKDQEDQLAVIAALEQQLSKAKKTLTDINNRVNKGKEIVDKLKWIDVEALTNQISQTDELNAKIRHRNIYAALENEIGELEERSNELTMAIKEKDQELPEALASAKLPIPGLGFSETGVNFYNIPYKQCSSSERLKIALSIAMAVNPEFRVIRIIDGSLLDEDNMKVIEEMTQVEEGEEEWQVWIERVGEKDPCAVIIEDGAIKKINPAAKKPAKKTKK